jgi:predicted AAA+ superfamily ATPase
MPLLLGGARQVGKTYACEEFGKEQYRNTAYFNMEDSRELGAVFERDLDPKRIIRELSALSGRPILPGETLVIFDEIQACGRALTSLKYFYEKAPEYHLIGTGSLLGLALNREKYSFPVGKVEMLTLYPLNFEEFLQALGRGDLRDLIRESYEADTPLSLHDTALDLYKIYLVCGGMPRPISGYIEKQDINAARPILKSLENTYIADMARYAGAAETTRIMAAWDSIPSQLAKENHKFQYRLIKSGARAHEYEMPLQWLQSAGLVNRCMKISEGKLPLSVYAEQGMFKIYMADTGLLCAKFNIPPEAVLHGAPGFEGFKGALAENYVQQALQAGDVNAYYWESAGKAEVDFVFQDSRGNVIPLEVKSASQVRSKSLSRFIELYKPEYAIRVSARNFGFEQGLKSVPLYAVFCIR